MIGILEQTARRLSRWEIAVVAAFLLLASALGAVASSSPLLAVGAGLAVMLLVAVGAQPAVATYLFLFFTPLIVGIDRGSVVPLLRPNEALLIFLLGAVVISTVLRLPGRTALSFRPNRVDAVLVGLAVTSSVLPLLWLYAREAGITLDDALFAVTIWKYYAIYLLVRTTVRTAAEVRTALWVTMASAAVVALIGILQALGVQQVIDVLAVHYAPFDDEGAVMNQRGTSTIASSLAVADVMTFNLAIAMAWLVRGHPRRMLLGFLALLFSVGALASGQFSSLIAIIVGVTAVGYITGKLGQVFTLAVPALGIASAALSPVLARRLSGFDNPEGLPPSWLGRLENLRTFFWPRLFSDFNLFLGVRPSARVAAPESWREWVWIESGHTWLLWTGGLPFFAAFLIFLWTTMKLTAHYARARVDAIGAAATASFSSLWVIAILMILDPHLTLRGSADLSFPLLALALTAYRPTARSHPLPESSARST